MKFDQIYGTNELTCKLWQFQSNSRGYLVIVENNFYVNHPITKGLMNAIPDGATSCGKLQHNTSIFPGTKPQINLTTYSLISFCLALLAACIVISLFVDFNLAWLMMLGTALWAAKDSAKIGFHRYTSRISCGAVVLFLACALFWPVVFPWYLAMRCKIRAGMVMQNAEVTDVANCPE
jgi:hypothetical protein